MPKRPPKSPTLKEIRAAEAAAAAAAADDGLTLTDEEHDLNEFFGAIGSDFEVHLTRFEVNGDRSACGKHSWDLMRDDPADFIRKEWGAGKYQLTFRKTGGGYTGIYGSKRMIVAKKVDAPQHTGGASPTSIADIHVQLLRDQMAQQQQLFMTMIGQKGGGGDLGQIITGLATMFRPPDPVAQFAAIMTAVQSTKNDDPFSKLKDIIEISKSINGGGGEEGNWISIAGKVLDRIPALGPGKPATPAPAEKPAAAAAAPPQQTAEELEQEFMQELSKGLDLLRADYKAGIKQEDAVQKVWTGQKTEKPFNAIVSAIASNGTIEQLFVFNPALVEDPQEKVWFEMVYDGLKKAYDASTTATA